MDFVTVSTGLILPYWMGLPIRYIQLQIGDSWYYFDENDGHMISSARKLMYGNYYHFKKDGTMASGWYSYAMIHFTNTRMYIILFRC